MVFAWNVDGSNHLYWVPPDGSGEVERLTTSDVSDVSTSVTPDGGMVLFARIDGNQREIWQVPLDGERTPTPLLQGEFARGNADVSPDGNWMAYRSDQSGQLEVYLQPYPGPGPTVPVSIGGGDLVTWSSDGSELFYRVDNRMMAVAVSPDGTVTTPTQLFEGNYFPNGPGVRARGGPGPRGTSPVFPRMNQSSQEMSRLLDSGVVPGCPLPAYVRLVNDGAPER